MKETKMIVLKTLQFTKLTATALIITLALAMSFLVVEPILGLAIEDQFTITQSVTAEISFLTAATDITMSPTIAGLTGGTSNGQTQIVVNTNNAAGYTMTIVASSSPAMQGNTGGGTIPNYTPASASIPDYTFSVTGNTGEFGYSVSASTTSDLAQKFLDNTTTCNTGSADTGTLTSCWYALSTTATSTINRTTATSASGATTTIFFRVQITANPAPAIPQATYTATTTLTATAT